MIEEADLVLKRKTESFEKVKLMSVSENKESRSAHLKIV